MNFYKRRYKVFVMLAGPDAADLWRSAVWAHFAQDLLPYACSVRGRTAVRATQYSSEGKTVSFGRLGWDDKSHAKWTHVDSDDSRMFVHVEAWSPSWGQCEREDLAPDFYLSVSNERMRGRAGKLLRFSQRVICALAQDQEDEKAEALQDVLIRWASRIQSPLLAYQVRPWGFESGSCFVGAIQDLASSGLFMPGDPHSRPLDATSLVETWTVVPYHDS
jgi:hypothetical protein